MDTFCQLLETLFGKNYLIKSPKKFFMKNPKMFFGIFISWTLFKTMKIL